MNMFNAVSWQQYFTILGIGLVVYYLFIIGIYYRKQLFRFCLSPLFKYKIISSGQTADAIPVDAQQRLLSPAVHELMEDLQVLFYKAEQHGYEKEELIMALQVTLGNYNMLKGTQFQDSILQYVQSETQTRCGIRFDDAESGQLW